MGHLARGIDARTRGLLAMAGGRLTYATSDCVDLTVERLELDENDVHRVAGKLCPEAGPLLSSKDGIWRVAGGFQGVSADAPFLGLGRVAFEPEWLQFFSCCGCCCRGCSRRGQRRCLLCEGRR